MFPESLSGKYLLLFHCSLLACINPLLYYILPSVCYHLCWEHCSDNLQDLDLLLFYFMFCWMTSPADPWAGYLGSGQRRVFQKSLASGWSCHIQNAVVCSTCALPRTPPEFLSLAYRSLSLSWKCLYLGSNTPTLCSDLASCPSLRGNVTLPALTCRAQIAEKFCSASICYNHWSWSWAREEWKCYSQTISLTASSLSFVNGSYQQNRWWLQVPSDNFSFSMPKAFVEFASFPALILTAVISPVSQAVVTYGGAGKSKRISRSPENLRW